MKLIIFSLIIFLLQLEKVFSNCNFWLCEKKIDSWLIWSNKWNITEATMDLLFYFLSFLALVWIAFVIKWWFQILISSSDDDKFKNWKKTIIYSLLWIFIVIIAITIVTSIFWSLEEIKK